VNLAKRRSSRPISYGYASLYPFREEFELNDEDWYEEEGEEAEEEDDGRNPPCTTSSVAADEIERIICLSSLP
jgi:hypothetical protein